MKWEITVLGDKTTVQEGKTELITTMVKNNEIRSSIIPAITFLWTHNELFQGELFRKCTKALSLWGVSGLAR